ncbi:histidine kinase,PAS domain-containing protein,histidine kinase [Desulfocurvibacter africanus PCS]|uniref:histidine kinase n=1 Tax=Desulfocurvibacter africanus PCS TaxID=1262666 RepID=M5Q232_DESAF|nr:ATP-binding protein [Desulfocurvibacter africanus]EMG37073.1 histidine kinase,PAS domain-containing protein,histidine kinase [Desulfocurvibacter africanus PCS]
MEISVTQSRRLPLLVAIAATGIVAASLILATWNSVRQQRELVMRHMLLSAQVVLRSTQSHLQGSLRRMGPDSMRRRGFHGSMDAPPPSLTADLLTELTQDSDVRFLGLLDTSGDIIISSAPEAGRAFALSAEGLRGLRETGHWHSMQVQDGERVLYLAERARPAVARSCQGMQSRGFPDSRGPEHSPDDSPAAGGRRPPTLYLVMGLGVEEYLGIYYEFQRTAIYQTGFILAAAAGFLAFFTYYLRRREQSRAYQALQRFHARLLDDMPDGLLSLDGQGIVRAANPAAHAILDRAPGTLVGSALDWLPLGQAINEENGGEAWAETELGSKRLEVLRRSVGEADDGPGSSLVLVRDRTRLKALERSLAEAEKLAAVGRLAAGVAHEIRNPLSALRGFAQFFLKKLQGVQPDEEYARTMVREADRLNKVITDMLFLARPQSLTPQEVDTTTLFEDLRRLLEGEAAKAGAELRFEARTPSVHADSDGLKQVLLNLIMNSLAALPETGGQVNVTAEPAGNDMLLSVADNGRGFSPEAREHALEPFFTTRAQGTGLGLAIAHKLVQDHGGRLEIESEEGRGAIVRVFLPSA